MSAIKQQQSAQPFEDKALAIEEMLTQQERKALRLIWCDDTSECAQVQRYESSVEHCAELGYN